MESERSLHVYRSQQIPQTPHTLIPNKRRLVMDLSRPRHSPAGHTQPQLGEKDVRDEEERVGAPFGGIKSDGLEPRDAFASQGIVNLGGGGSAGEKGRCSGYREGEGGGAEGAEEEYEEGSDEGSLNDASRSLDNNSAGVVLAGEGGDGEGAGVDEADLAAHMQRQRLIKRRVILEVLGSQAKTEKEILDAGVGDSRYAREVLRRLCAEGKIYRSGAGGGADPYRYTAARYYEGAQERLLEVPVEVRLQRIAKRIQEVLMSTSEGNYMTERDIRAAVGDNIGTGKALRLLHRTGCIARMGKGGGTQPFQYSFLRCGEF
jgi:hypothetical protein